MLPSCTSNPKTGDYILYPPTLISELGGVISVDTPFSEQLQTYELNRVALEATNRGTSNASSLFVSRNVASCIIASIRTHSVLYRRFLSAVACCELGQVL